MKKLDTWKYGVESCDYRAVLGHRGVANGPGKGTVIENKLADKAKLGISSLVFILLYIWWGL